MIFQIQLFFAQANDDDGFGSIINIIFVIVFVLAPLLIRLAKFIGGQGKETSESQDENNSEYFDGSESAEETLERSRNPWEIFDPESEFDKIQNERREQFERSREKPAPAKPLAVPVAKKKISVPARSKNPSFDMPKNVAGTVLKTENSASLAKDVRVEISASRDSLRKAFLMSEILGTPKGLREFVDPYEPQ